MAEVSTNEKLDAILTCLQDKVGYTMSAHDIWIQSALICGELMNERDDLLVFLSHEGMLYLHSAKGEDDKLSFTARILPKGSLFLNDGGYVKQNIEKNSLERLNKEKLTIDVEQAKRVLKSYPATQIMAIIACVVSVALLFLEIARALNIWPYNSTTK